MHDAVPRRPLNAQVVRPAGMHPSHGLQVEGEGAALARPVAVYVMGRARGALELILANDGQLEPVH